MGTRRSEALIKEIAALVVKYNFSDWKILLDELRNGGDVQQDIVKLVEGMYAEKQRSARRESPTPQKKRYTPPRDKSVDQELAVVDPGRRDIIADISKAIRDRVLLPTTSDIREVYIKYGGKGPIPTKREAATRALIILVAQLPDDQFRNALDTIGERQRSGTNSLASDYSRWFDIIYKRPS